MKKQQKLKAKKKFSQAIIDDFKTGLIVSRIICEKTLASSYKRQWQWWEL